ncbi:MAG: sulfurtransferase [Actinomycetes bacterium]
MSLFSDFVIDPRTLAATMALEAPPEATLLDVRWQLGRDDGREQYLAGHVPGAAYVDLGTDLADPVGDGSRGRHPLPDPERFGAAMRRCGVRQDRPVVVYDDVAGSSAARAWWLLTYHGHPDVRVLERGFSAYVAADGPVETGEADVEAGDFEPDPGHLPLIDAGGAARLAAVGRLVDVRVAERYRGEHEPVDPVAGHIPGATNIPFDQPDRFAEVPTDVGEVGVYCGSGVTAAFGVLQLRRRGVDAALYPGSWSEWVSDPARPVETGP